MSATGWPEGTDDLVDEALTDAYGEDEQLWSWLCAFEENVPMPCDGEVVGAPVEVLAISYEGNPLRGLTALVRRGDAEHVVAACDLTFPVGSDGARYVAAYRKWVGLAPVTR